MKKSSRRSRRHRNPKSQEENKKPFFSKSKKAPEATTSDGAFFQPKLTVGQPGDKYEQEADAVADAVVNKTNQPSEQTGNTPAIQQKNISSIQRYATNAKEDELGTNTQRIEKDKMIQEKPIQKKEGEEEEPVQMMEEEEAIQGKEEEEPIQKMEEEEETVQTKEEEEPVQMMEEEEESIQAKEEEEETVQAKTNTSATQNTASPNVAKSLNQSKGSGSSLPKSTQTEMENSFGVDFSNVRIHTNDRAVQMNKDLGAQAFTHGKDVYFNEGKFSPTNMEGKRLLAHELTHVVQQGGKEIKRKDQETTSNQSDTSNEISPQVSHFKVELKAWIPHSKVVDPEEHLRAGNWLDTLGFGHSIGLDYEYQSFYRGDNHTGYQGSYRVLSVMEFDWDGNQMFNFKHSGHYGTTHRDYNFQLIKDNIWPIPDLTLLQSNGSDNDTATTATNGMGGANMFRLGMASANPLVLTWAPDIDSFVYGFISNQPGNPQLVLRYQTDQFPSHGVAVYKDGKSLTQKVVKDASSKLALGPIGAAVIGKGLTSKTNTGNIKIPI